MNNLILVTWFFASTLGACKWTTFDDLKEEAWVNATTKPDRPSTNWGVAINRGTRAGAGGKLAVMGTAESVYNEIELAANGGAKIAGNEQKLNAQFGIGNLEVQPILLADPTTDDVALVTSSGAGQVVVLKGTSGDLVPHQVFGPTSADAAVYMVAPGIDGGATPQPAQPLVASADRVFGTFFTLPEPQFNQPKCQLVDAALAPVTIRALGAVRLVAAATTDDVIVWSSTGKLFIYAGGIFDGARGAACVDPNLADTDNTGVSTPAAILAGPLDVAFAPGIGSQILVFANAAGEKFAVLQGHSDATGFLGVVNLQTMTLLTGVNTDPGLKAAALLELPTGARVIAGYPTAVVEGANAGAVKVFPVDTTNGLGTLEDTLFDAEPEEGQLFGRSIATLSYNSKPIIAVGANNEVFTYFRTSFYEDTRTR